MKFLHLAGSRVVKTGISVFITAWICVLLDWPPVFAVITAIVTIEPTVGDSIKKGFVRFPASAIGSAYAVTFISLFDNSPLTYTLAAVLTIATCFKLRLHAGLLVATLTAVAMIEVIHSNFFVSFLIRLGTTTTGLVVSTLVNMFVFPPDYTDKISKKLKEIAVLTGMAAEKVFHDILEDHQGITSDDRELSNQLSNSIRKTETLIRYQQEESKYHPLVGSEKTKFQQEQDQLIRLRLVHYHIRNMIYTPVETIPWSKEERQIIINAVTDLAQSLKHEEAFDHSKHQKQYKELIAIFWEDNEEITRNNKKHPTSFPPELIILYELVSIYQLVEEYYEKPL